MIGPGVEFPRMVTRTSVSVLALVSVLFLAACGSSRPIKTLEDTQSATPEVHEPAANSELDGEQSSRSGRAVRPLSDTDNEVASSTADASPLEADGAAAGEAELAALPPVNEDPDSFLSLGPQDIAARLGAPLRIRRDGQAEIHQYRGEYRGAGCILDLFLYPKSDAASLDTADLRVTYVELRGDSLTKAERRECLADMLRAHLRVG